MGGLIRSEGCRWEYFGGLSKIGGGDVMGESVLRIASTRGGGLNSCAFALTANHCSSSTC